MPVYNVEKYVGKCLSSLMEQTFTDFEVICVNDGARDTSPEILRHFESRYDNVKVIDQKNAGMSQARNTGMRAARGEYIAFTLPPLIWRNCMRPVSTTTPTSPAAIIISILLRAIFCLSIRSAATGYLTGSRP